MPGPFFAEGCCWCGVADAPADAVEDGPGGPPLHRLRELGDDWGPLRDVKLCEGCLLANRGLVDTRGDLFHHLAVWRDLVERALLRQLVLPSVLPFHMDTGRSA